MIQYFQKGKSTDLALPIHVAGNKEAAIEKWGAKGFWEKDLPDGWELCNISPNLAITGELQLDQDKLAVVAKREKELYDNKVRTGWWLAAKAKMKLDIVNKVPVADWEPLHLMIHNNITPTDKDWEEYNPKYVIN